MQYTSRNVPRILILILGFVISSNIKVYSMPSEDGFEVRIELDGIHDTVLYLANYYGDKTYLTDTAYRDKRGLFVFSADTTLPTGIYILAGQNNNKYLEFIMDQNQKIDIHANLKGMPGNITYKNSPDNDLFLSYITRSIEVRKESDSLMSLIKNNKLDEDSAEIIRVRVEKIKQGLSAYQQGIIDENQGSFVASILSAMQDPPNYKDSDLYTGTYDTIQAYQYYKKHYFDKLDLADSRLLRTPLYHRQLHNYFSKVLYQQTDTIVQEADRIVGLAQKDKETFKYVIWYLTYTFETSKIMGFDEVFVHMIDSYYAKGLAYWADSSIVKSLTIRSNELRNLLIGSTAPNMILLDTLGTFKSLYQLKSKYVIVLFYEPDCAHCRNEVKELKKWIPESPFDIEVFAVCADTSIQKWKSYIRKNELDWVHVNGTRTVTPDYHKLYDIRTTPTIYLLDENKTIIAKRLKTDQLIPFIINYDRTSVESGTHKSP